MSFRPRLIAGLLLLPLVIVACGGDDDDAPSSSPSEAASASPSQSASPATSTDAVAIAEAALLQLSDVPDGFEDQGGDVTGGATEGVLAIGSASYSREVNPDGNAITIDCSVLVLEDEDAARLRMEEDHVSSTTTGIYGAGLTDIEAGGIDFPSLGDEVTAIEMTGTGGEGSDTFTIGVRTVAVRHGNVVGTVTTTAVGLGPIEEIEGLAETLNERMSEAVQH
jgi:hypothetical protein